MKAKVLILAGILSLLAFTSAFPQSVTKRDYLLTWDGAKKSHTLGAYAELNGSYATVNSKASAFFGTKAGIVIDKHWGIGVAGKTLWHDYELTELVTDGKYQLQAGYGGWFIEYMCPVGNRVRLSASLTSGYGLAKYEYMKDYQFEHRWYDRTIDQDVFHINEPAIEVQVRIFSNWWLGVNGSYRNIGNLDLQSTDKNILTGFSGGLSLKYGIF